MRFIKNKRSFCVYFAALAPKAKNRSKNFANSPAQPTITGSARRNRPGLAVDGGTARTARPSVASMARARPDDGRSLQLTAARPAQRDHPWRRWPARPDDGRSLQLTAARPAQRDHPWRRWPAPGLTTAAACDGAANAPTEPAAKRPIRRIASRQHRRLVARPHRRLAAPSPCRTAASPPGRTVALSHRRLAAHPASPHCRTATADRPPARMRRPPMPAIPAAGPIGGAPFRYCALIQSTKARISSSDRLPPERRHPAPAFLHDRELFIRAQALFDVPQLGTEPPAEICSVAGHAIGLVDRLRLRRRTVRGRRAARIPLVRAVVFAAAARRQTKPERGHQRDGHPDRSFHRSFHPLSVDRQPARRRAARTLLWRELPAVYDGSAALGPGMDFFCPRLGV